MIKKMQIPRDTSALNAVVNTVAKKRQVNKLIIAFRKAPGATFKALVQGFDEKGNRVVAQPVSLSEALDATINTQKLVADAMLFARQSPEFDTVSVVIDKGRGTIEYLTTLKNRVVKRIGRALKSMVSQGILKIPSGKWKRV